MKKRSDEGGGKVDGGNRKRGIRGDKLKFDYELIKEGIDEGQRHNTLVSFIGHLIWRDLSKEQIMVLVTDWNEKNRPPLPKEELAATVDYCYSRYAKEKPPAKKYVPTKTLNNFNSVIVETKEYPRIDRRNRLFIPESPNSTPASDMAGSWETESDRVYTYQDCGKKRAIMRKGRAYMSVSFFCGRWDCSRCGPYFRQRWIEHITTETEGMELYVTKISEEDWAHVRRAINRLGADYMKIKADDVY